MLSLLTPIALKLLPTKKIPINIQIFQEFRENESLNLDETKKKIDAFIKESPPKVLSFEEKMPFDFYHFALFFWSFGIFFFGGKLSLNYFRLKKILVKSMVYKKSAHLRIVVTENAFVPFSVRMFTSYWVVIPVNLLSCKKDLQLAIKHEIQHHRQGDTSWAIFIELLICIFYFNPIIYLWKNTIIEFQEFSCDEALTGQEGVLSHDYGSCLLRVAETALKNHQMYAGTTCMAVVFKDSKYFKTFLLRRIEMIVKEKRSNSKWIPVCTGFVIASLTIAFAYGVEKISQEKPHNINEGTLIVDNDVQKIADAGLAKALRGTRFSAGFIIVSDPMTGKVLAVANADKRNIKKGHWALSELIEPASIAKTFVIAHALEANVTTAEDIHQCENGEYIYKGKLYRDWKEKGWKQLTTAQALINSSNICSIKIAELVGTKSLEEMVETFGFGENGTAKNFPEARVGETPIIGEQFIPKMTLGSAFRSSPLEIMQAYGAIANGGNLMKPIMANAQKSEIMRRILSVENAQKMKKILQGVVLSGTGKGSDRAESLFYTTAGKTASGRLNDFINSNKYDEEYSNFAGFVGFAPVINPRVQVFVVLIDSDADRNKTGASGGEHAAPVFKEVADNVLSFMKVAPDKF
jgi:hypothetical protein